MPTELVKCGWCGSDRYPNELRRSEKLDCMVCPDCDADNTPTMGEIKADKKGKARGKAWLEGWGWAV